MMRLLQGALLFLPAVLAAPVAYDDVDECEVDPASTVESSSTVAATVAVESTSSAVVASSTISSTLSSVVSSSVTSSVASTNVAAVTTSAASSSSAVVSASSSVVASSSSSAANATATGNSTAGLNTYAQAKGLVYFGTATDNPELTDTAYVTILNETNQFGQITPGNSQKWDATEPTQGTFTYTKGDAIVDLAEANGQRVRCHNLVWYNQLPSWVTSGTWTNETLIAALQNHITNLVTYWGSSCYAWDVVNEPFYDNGTYRSDIFYDTIGPEYIPIAFAAATAAAPSDVKLYLNEYNIEYAGNKATAVEELVTDLKSRSDLRIDGVGLQSHFIVGSTPSKSAQSSQMAAFVALDVEVAITELDIRMTLPATTALLDQQAVDYNSTVSACVDTTGCIGVTIWDYTDKYSWVPNTFSGQGEACPWDADLVEKPAYDGIVSALTS